MFCPKCGKTMKDNGDEFVCVDGNMGLSQNLTNCFRECYEQMLRKPLLRPSQTKRGGDWFCPKCGVQEQEQNGSILCPQCQLALDEFIFQLVELHSHKGWPPNPGGFNLVKFLKIKWAVVKVKLGILK